MLYMYIHPLKILSDLVPFLTAIIKTILTAVYLYLHCVGDIGDGDAMRDHGS